MTPLLFICIGFVIAVLWIDLKFDWLSFRYRGQPGVLPEKEVLAPMTYYYRYVTGKPVVILIVLLFILFSIISQIVQAVVPGWVAWTSLILFGATMMFAALRVIPAARRFGTRVDSLEEQSRVALALFTMHFFEFLAILTVAGLQIYAAWK